METAQLTLVRQPFDHPDFLFELKHDGFRALAYNKRNPRITVVGKVGLNVRVDFQLGKFVRRCENVFGEPQPFGLLEMPENHCSHGV